MSPPVWGRGLKYLLQAAKASLERSPPVWGRGLKCSRSWTDQERFCRPRCGGVG